MGDASSNMLFKRGDAIDKVAEQFKKHITKLCIQDTTKLNSSILESINQSINQSTKQSINPQEAETDTSTEPDSVMATILNLGFDFAVAKGAAMKIEEWWLKVFKT